MPNRDVAAVLTRLGNAFAHFMCNRSTSPIRTVIAIADRMPEIGRQFYETGPAVGIAKLARYLEAQVAAGVLGGRGLRCRGRTVPRTRALSATFKPVLFNFARPSPARAHRLRGRDRGAHVHEGVWEDLRRVARAANLTPSRHRA